MPAAGTKLRPLPEWDKLPRIETDLGIAVLLPLTHGQVARVDLGDAALVASHRWHALRGRHTFYAARDLRHPGGHRTGYLHRILMEEPEGMQVDHIDGDGLNNQRGNLRVVDNSRNQQNSRKWKPSASRFKGVSYHKASGLWHPEVGCDGKRHSMGYFKDEEDAARAYDAKARELFGAFAHLNFPDALPS